MERDDDQFGRMLLIDGPGSDETSWLTAVSIRYFRAYGKSLGIGAPDEPVDEYDSEALFRHGKFRLNIVCGERGKRPAEEQRLAWRQVLERGDALWDELMDRVVGEYKLQRPMRLRGWELTFGRKGIRRWLPELKGATEMKKLIRPYELWIRAAETPGEPAEVEVRFYSLWFNGMTVRIRAGQVIAFRRNPFRQMNGKESPIDLAPRLRHPVLGALSWSDGVWYGAVRCDPFLNFMNVARYRAEFENSGEDANQIESTLCWDLARGEFLLKVFSGGTNPPTKLQVRTLQKFKAAETENAKTIVDAIFDEYTRGMDERQDRWMAPSDDLHPKLKNADELRDRLELDSINLSPRGKGSDREIGFEIPCSWDINLGVIWRDGKVIEVGSWRICRPKWAMKRTKKLKTKHS